jgi:hypothetical protein
MAKSPEHSAYDYGTPTAATRRVFDTLVEGIGSASIDLGQPSSMEMAKTGSRVVLDNLAATVVHDLVTSGLMVPSVPATLDDEQPRMTAENYRLTCPHCGHTIGLGDDGVCTNESCT